MSKAERIGEAHSADLNEREKEFIRVSLAERNRLRFQEGRKRITTYLIYILAASIIVFSIVYVIQQQRAQQAQTAQLQSLFDNQRRAEKQIESLNLRLIEAQERNDELTKELLNLQRRNSPR